MNSTRASRNDFKEFAKFLIIYHSKKTQLVGIHIEKAKNTSVKALMHRRGRFQKQILHSSIISLASVGILSSGVMGQDSLLASSFPGASDSDPRIIQTFDPNANGVSLDSMMDFKTSVSDKPRSEIIEYEVKSGETLSQIAEKFGISSDTIMWANDMSSKNSIKPGQKLKILPVSGVAVTVKSGDTLEGIAKKYQANADTILQYPFNDITDDFKLKVGDTLIVPEGQPPEVKTPVKKSTQYIAKSPTSNSSSFSAPNGGSFIWPTTFQMITTYFAWWHPGIDMANRAAPGVAAADGGTVTVAGWPDNYGYGNRVVIDHGNGYSTLYAHLSNIYVSVGQKVSRGQSIGKMGSTGRSTGTHLHFEIHFKGIAINPLAILK
jgi:murein DD-endopeptidase MepM/ murein hydrolase activator NlpD